ncbi:MAG: 50S ribosomal protein L9 [Kiritimatiellae bacterium]|nr:50S ribosomal protein L9 [Kiritimatiellia bacterium]
MTEVLLMADVKKLGKAGEVVKVAPGYARNMLFPQDLAAPVTEAARRRLAKLEAERAKVREEKRKEALAIADRLKDVSLTVSAPTVDGTRLYGSVNVTDLVAAIEANRGVKLSRHQINLPDQLKEIGTYEAKIDLGSGITVPFKVWIVEEAKAEGAEA